MRNLVTQARERGFSLISSETSTLQSFQDNCEPVEICRNFGNIFCPACPALTNSFT